MQRLSQDLSTLESHYDVIVVGSGYGGSIAACRLARTGASVALFERGRELHPGEYPSTKDEAAHEIQASLPGTSDSTDNGLYRFHVGKDMSVFSGCGLGGTSLVNANVSLEPDGRVLDDPRWPAALRSDAEGMQAAFERARAMLGPTTYPSSYPPLPKMTALKVAAGTDPWYPTPINVTFRAGPTAAGVHQEACTNCGDCVTGCNHGAKNTVLMNYLPDAVSHGARIFCELDVRWIEKGEGTGPWAVHVQPIGEGRDRFDAPPLVVTADVVVLAAGTLGTTGILLRSAEQGLSLSRQLGKHFTGNGDVLGFAYLPKTDVHGTGAGDRRPEAEDSSGPCITSVIDRRPGRAVEDGIVIEDAVIPGAIANLLPIELATQIAPDWLRGRLPGSGPLSWLTSLVTGGRKGLTRHLQTFLVMGNDDDEGTLVLDGDRVRIEWPGIGTTPFYEQANQSLRTAAANGGGQFLENPLWSGMLGHSLVTVHPLGGCVMADSADRGVVDHRGAVFAGADGTEVHEGLYAWDGSIVPRPLGVNPLLTISALTERAAALLAAERRWTIDPMPATDRKDDALGPEGPPPRPGLRFTEEMDGFWTPAPDAAPAGDTEPTGDLTPYLDGFETGRKAGDASALSFVLTLSTDDIAAEIDHTDRPMTAVGTLQIPALSGDPLEVADGRFQLLVADDSTDSDVRHMWYRLPAVASDGSRYHFEGFKVVTPGNVTDVWPDTTTLYVTLRRGSPDGPVLGRGILRIEAADFARQLSTVAVTGRVSAASGSNSRPASPRPSPVPWPRTTGTSSTAPRSSDPTLPRDATVLSTSRNPGCSATGQPTAWTFASPGIRVGSGGRSSSPTAWGTRATTPSTRCRRRSSSIWCTATSTCGCRSGGHPRCCPARPASSPVRTSCGSIIPGPWPWSGRKPGGTTSMSSDTASVRSPGPWPVWPERSNPPRCSAPRSAPTPSPPPSPGPRSVCTWAS